MGHRRGRCGGNRLPAPRQPATDLTIVFPTAENPDIPQGQANAEGPILGVVVVVVSSSLAALQLYIYVTSNCAARASRARFVYSDYVAESFRYYYC